MAEGRSIPSQPTLEEVAAAAGVSRATRARRREMTYASGKRAKAGRRRMAGALNRLKRKGFTAAPRVQM